MVAAVPAIGMCTAITALARLLPGKAELHRAKLDLFWIELVAVEALQGSCGALWRLELRKRKAVRRLAIFGWLVYDAHLLHTKLLLA
jgi:hypothetical protein